MGYNDYESMAFGWNSKKSVSIALCGLYSIGAAAAVSVAASIVSSGKWMDGWTGWSLPLVLCRLFPLSPPVAVSLFICSGNSIRVGDSFERERSQ